MDMCEEKLTDKEITEKILASIKEQYGFIPVINQILSQRPDIFVPSANLSKAVLENEKGNLDKKTRYLCAISAATASGGEYCLNVQMDHAIQSGATKDEILEAIVIGSYLTMTKAQSYALRKFDEKFKE